MRVLIPAMILAALALPATAQTEADGQTETCEASITGEVRELTYDPSEEAVAANTSLRESALRRFGTDACPGYVVLREFTPALTDAERGPFCLAHDREAGTYAGFSQGARDAYGICTEPATLCERVNATTEQARTIAGLPEDPSLADAAAAAGRGANALRETAAGATLLTGSSGFVNGILGQAGASALAAVTAPAGMAAAAVSVVAVGGAVYVCN